MKIINCTEVFTNSDLDEGRGHNVTIAYFTTASDAMHAASGKGIMGGDADIRHVQLRIFDTFSEFQRHENCTLRAQALAKLTQAEREALGFGDNTADEDD